MTCGSECRKYRSRPGENLPDVSMFVVTTSEKGFALRGVRELARNTKAEMRRYLQWELNLIDQAKRDGTLSLPRLAP